MARKAKYIDRKRINLSFDMSVEEQRETYLFLMNNKRQATRLVSAAIHSMYFGGKQNSAAIAETSAPALGATSMMAVRTEIPKPMPQTYESVDDEDMDFLEDGMDAFGSA